MEGHGALVHRFIIRIARVTIQDIEVFNYHFSESSVGKLLYGVLNPAPPCTAHMIL